VSELAPLLAALFLEPVRIAGGSRLLLLLPLAASVSVVYKTIRCDNLSEVPLESLRLWATIVTGMLAVGVALLLGFRLLL
jgi:hypothetical protein